MEADVDDGLGGVAVHVGLESAGDGEAAHGLVVEIRRPEELEHGAGEVLVAAAGDAGFFRGGEFVAEDGVEIGPGGGAAARIAGPDDEAEGAGDGSEEGVGQALEQPPAEAESGVLEVLSEGGRRTRIL